MVLQNNPPVQMPILVLVFNVAKKRNKKYYKLYCWSRRRKNASPTFGFLLKISTTFGKSDLAKIGRMATCVGALRWATCYCFFQKTNFKGCLRFLGQTHHPKILVDTVLKCALRPKWSVPSNFFLYNLLYVT